MGKILLKNHQVNGFYRKFDQDGRQVMEIPIVDNLTSGSGCYIDARNIRREVTFKNEKIIEP